MAVQTRRRQWHATVVTPATTVSGGCSSGGAGGAASTTLTDTSEIDCYLKGCVPSSTVELNGLASFADPVGRQYAACRVLGGLNGKPPVFAGFTYYSVGLLPTGNVTTDQTANALAALPHDRGQFCADNHASYNHGLSRPAALTTCDAPVAMFSVRGVIAAPPRALATRRSQRRVRGPKRCGDLVCQLRRRSEGLGVKQEGIPDKAHGNTPTPDCGHVDVGEIRICVHQP